MNDGPHRYQLFDGIDVLVLQAQLAHKRQPTVDHFFAHVAKIKMDDWSVWSFRRAALLHLFDEGLGETITRAEFHVAQDGLVSRRAEIVILEIAVPILVDQISALGASRFRDERSEEHTSELQSRLHLVCRLLLEKKKTPQTALSTAAPLATTSQSIATI